MSDPTVERPALLAITNFRDLGGWQTSDGRAVVTGRLFRSAALDKASDDDRTYLAGLGLRSIYDLRSTVEKDAAPDPVLDGVLDVHLDVLADAQSVSAPANLDKLLTDPETAAAANERLADGSGVTRMVEAYRELVNLPSAQRSYHRLFRGLLDDTAALFHCTAGKDRTGWAAASLLTLLGVGRDDVYREYLLTNDLFLPSLASVFDGFAAAGGDPELLKPLLGAQATYLDSAFAEVERLYGSIENYFDSGLGLDRNAQAELRSRYLVDS
ncbi:tyrosine-protein phosphatase [Gordonia sp. CPCC 206044]|uniref:tyrosine-protein phosphatase n=1 Tax=Gordonia sp. CPCC 206044 TaxID=3140793 RepID=UPI003AF3C539